jgi:hypothetical protein
MEAIKLSTKLGNCELEISAQVQNDKTKQLAEYAMQYLVWHVIPAEAYKKGSAFKRDSAYSDELSGHMVSTCNAELAKFFSDIEIKTAKWNKPDPIAKLIKEFISLGMDEASAKAMADQVQAKVASKTEEKTEASVEA